MDIEYTAVAGHGIPGVARKAFPIHGAAGGEEAFLRLEPVEDEQEPTLLLTLPDGTQWHITEDALVRMGQSCRAARLFRMGAEAQYAFAQAQEERNASR